MFLTIFTFILQRKYAIILIWLKICYQKSAFLCLTTWRKQMANFHRIQSVKNRIQILQTRFKTPMQSLNAGVIPFDNSFKRELGAQTPNSATADFTTGPNSLNALLNSMRAIPKTEQITTETTFKTATDAASKLVNVASEWTGKAFKAGQTARCADFVSTMIKKTGLEPSSFRHEVNVWEMQKQGKKVDKKDLKPGDIVYFGYTYLPVDYTHVGIYIGDGKFVHRPTADKPVRIDSLNTGYFANKYSSARRLW
jgi:cell wall-associated NlpC family hydrolase